MHPEFGISKQAMNALNSAVQQALDTLLDHARVVKQKDPSNSTLSENDIMTAVRLGMSPNLAQHALQASKVAVARYKNSFASAGGAAEPLQISA